MEKLINSLILIRVFLLLLGVLNFDVSLSYKCLSLVHLLLAYIYWLGDVRRSRTSLVNKFTLEDEVV